MIELPIDERGRRPAAATASRTSACARDDRCAGAAARGSVVARSRVRVCRTDLHIVEGELWPHRAPLVLGQSNRRTVVARGPHVALDEGARAGVSWLGAVDETCRYCRAGRENLCDHPTFTGYDRDGGYAEYVVANAAFTYPLPEALDDLHAAPLLCAGIIGFRALRVAGVKPGEFVGLYARGVVASPLRLEGQTSCVRATARRGLDRRRARPTAGTARSCGDFRARRGRRRRGTRCACEGRRRRNQCDPSRPDGVLRLRYVALGRARKYGA